MHRINVLRDTEFDGQILDGYFDLDKATRIEDGTYWDGNNNRGNNSRDQWRTQNLLRTAGGRWVIAYYTSWQGEQDRYEFVDDDRAKKWLEVAEQYDQIEKYFGEQDEERGPGRPGIDGTNFTVKFPTDLLTQVDQAAETAGISRAEWLRRAAQAQHLHSATLQCWTPTLCAGHAAYIKLRAFAVNQGDDQLLTLVDQLAEHLPAAPATT